MPVLLRLSVPTLLIFVLAVPAAGDVWKAAGDGDVAAVRAHLAAGGKVDAADRYGSTPLLFAARAGRMEVVELLLEKGADPNVEERFYHQTPFDVALGGRHEDVALRLLEAGARVDSPWTLYSLAQSGQLGLLRALTARRTLHDFEAASLRMAAAEVAESEEATAEEKARAREIDAFVAELQTIDELVVVDQDEAKLRGLAGLYRGQMGEAERTIEVTVRPGGLAARVEGKDPVELVAVSPHHFRSPERHDVGMVFMGRSSSIERVAWVDGKDVYFLPPFHPEDELAAEGEAPGRVETEAPEEAPRAEPVQWGSFRGPGGSGVGDGQGVPVSWDVESGENVLWSTEVPGLANSSPVVSGARVYVTTAISAQGDRSIRSGLYGDVSTIGDLSRHAWKVMAFDKAAGKLLWERTAGEAEPLTDRHAKSTQANSTPATDGRFVVAVFPTIGMFCYTSAGDLAWKKDLGPLNASWFYDSSVEWGFASSPILYDGKVILQADVAEGPFLAAWDLVTGREAWRVERDEIPTFTTPAIYRGERDELIANGTTIRGYDPKTGRELWSLGPNSEVIIAMPVVGRGLIYVGASYPPVRPLYAVRPGAEGDISLAEGEDSNRSVAWRIERGGSYMPTPIVYGDLLYVGHHQGRLITYEAATGEQVYRSRFSRQGTLTGSPVAADGRLYFPMEEGLVYVVRAGRTYEELAVNDMKEIVMTTPAISDGALVIRTRTHLFALGEKPAAAEGP